MTPAQKLMIRSSEIRQRLNELAGMDELTEELRGEVDTLTTELADVETRMRAAIAAEETTAEAQEHTPDAEERERLRLRAETTVSEFAAAAIGARAVSGPAAEYRAALGIAESGAGGPLIPLELFAPPGEHRTETDTDTQTTAMPWLMRLFARTGSEFLGITRRSVEPGRATYPTVTAGATPAQRGRDEAAAAAAWTTSAPAAEPKRIAAAVNIAGADMMRLPMLEEALTADLRASLVERMDRVVILGDTGANEDTADIAGLAGSTLSTAVEITQSNKVLGSGWLAALAGMLDGIAAAEPSDLAALVSVPAMTLLVSNYSLAANRSELTILEVLRNQGFMIRSRDGIETDTANADAGGFVARMNGIDGAAVHSVWEASELIADRYTGAREGQLRLTLAAYHDFTVVRAANYVPFSFVT